MRLLISLFILVFLGTPVLSQYSDLLVKHSGDSIACRIDSITQEHIYFEMRFNSKKTQTYIHLKDVREYKYSVINTKETKFEPGSSIIQSDSIAAAEQGKSVFYGTLGYFGLWAVVNVNYEYRIYSADEGFINSILFRMGGGAWAGWGVSGPHLVTGLTFLKGKKNNHFEANLGMTLLYDKQGYGIGVSNAQYENSGDPSRTDYMMLMPAGGLGYRYSKPGGNVIFRTGLSYPESAYISVGVRF